MANEKTEEATPRRREKEKDKGNIAKSQDFASSLMLAIGVGAFYAFSPRIFEHLRGLLYSTFTSLNPTNIPYDNPMSVLTPYVFTLSAILAPFFVILVIGAFLVKKLEIGNVFAKEVLKPKFDKLKPSQALKTLGQKLNPFAPKTLMELVKSLAKLAVVFMVGLNIILKRKDDLFALMGTNLDTSLAVLGSVVMEILFGVVIIMIIIGIIDKQYQTYEFNKSIKMTKQEVKDERRQAEGDPQIRQQQRKKMMEVMAKRMLQHVPRADVVITNPTHYAVALRYNSLETPAPVVVAKGADHLARKIREVALEHGVPIRENKLLARSLYEAVEVGDMIPETMYKAVAAILANLAKFKNKRRPR